MARGGAFGLGLAAFALLGQSAPAQSSDPGIIDGEVRTRILSNFRIGSDETHFGAFEFAGGLEMTSNLEHFGANSGFRFTDGGARFLGVTDTGFWFHGAVERDGEGRPTSVTGFQMRPIPDRTGAFSNDKSDTDAEGLTIGPDGTVVVSFERHHRISEYANPEGFSPAWRRDVDFVVPENEIRNNRGFETIAYAPGASALAGARVAVTEKSIDEAGNIFAAVLEGPLRGVFKIARSNEFDITDGDFLPEGDLLILERRFSMADSVGMRVRRIKGGDIRPGATVDGEIVLEADFNYQIDNMEGMDVWQNAAGQTMLSVVSDDNHSLLQRSLYLEFKLVD